MSRDYQPGSWLETGHLTSVSTRKLSWLRICPSIVVSDVATKTSKPSGQSNTGKQNRASKPSGQSNTGALPGHLGHLAARRTASASSGSSVMKPPGSRWIVVSRL